MTPMIDRTRAPPIGRAVVSREQEFECVALHPHTRRDGVLITVAVWRAACAECGEMFEFRAPMSGWHSPSRRCREHRRPGIRSHFTRHRKDEQDAARVEAVFEGKCRAVDAEIADYNNGSRG